MYISSCTSKRNLKRHVEASTSITPKQICKIRYPGDIQVSEYSPRTGRRFQICLDKIKRQNLIIRNLRRENHRKSRKISTLTGLLQELKSKCKLSEHASDAIEVGTYIFR